MLNFSGELCGYIYFTGCNSFMYYCTLCKSCFDSYKDFESHNLKEHFQQDNKPSIDSDTDIEDIRNSNLDTQNLKIKCYLHENETTTVLEEILENNLEDYSEFDTEIEENNFSEKNSNVIEIVKKEESLSSHGDDFVTENEGKRKPTNFIPSLLKINQITAEDSEKTNFSKIFIFEESNNLDEENLTCKFCKKQYNKKISLMEHTKKHLNYILTCNICGNHTSNLRRAQNHKKIHSKIKCDICDINFLNENALEDHNKRHDMLKCKYCPKIFKSLYAIQNHLKIHSGEKPYKCEICEADFAFKRYLKNHKIIKHTGDIKKFSCKLCEKKFKTKQLQNLHMRRMHLKEKPHQCELCGFNFSSRSGLRRHKLTHHTEYNKRPHHCKLCDKKFVEIQNLTEHMNTHTGEKPYHCNICSKGFGKLGTLREHKKLHTGKKGHVCKICGKAFAQISGCTNHMKQHHMVTT